MTDCYKTTKEVFKDLQEKCDKYDKLKRSIKKDIKKYRTLERVTKNEDYRLAYSILADYLDEIIKLRR